MTKTILVKLDFFTSLREYSISTSILLTVLKFIVAGDTMEINGKFYSSGTNVVISRALFQPKKRAEMQK